MEQFQVSRTGLLESCQRIFDFDIADKRVFFDAPRQANMHHVDRLLIMLEGKTYLKYSKDDQFLNCDTSDPLIIFSSAQSYLWSSSGPGNPTVSYSFSYFPTHIRAMCIDFDGIHKPPTMRDIFYHTSKPLSAAGMQLIDTLYKLHEQDCDDIAGELLMPLLRLTLKEIAGDDAAPSPVHVSKRWSRICNFIHTNCCDGVSREQVAKVFQITPNYVSNLCRKYSGMSFSELKLSYQLEYAEKLLLNTDLAIKEIAQNCGFAGSNYFVRSFKKIHNITPAAYRNQQNRNV